VVRGDNETHVEYGIRKNPVIEGSRFGPYELIKRIGYGGMAEIYLASTRGIGGFEKLLALKVLHARFAQDQEFVDMLIDEAKLAVQLTHVNICQVFDLGCIDERYYIAMEFVDGRDLYQLMVQSAENAVNVPFDIAAFIGREIASGLDYAHNKKDRYRRPMNLVHRDVSPQNLLISFDGQVKLVDFGIAKATARRQQTESGVIKGKFFYMSPEQAWGDELDGRSDVFSCGICLYEMVAGEMLYNEEQPMVLLDRVRNAKIPPLRDKRPDVPRELERIINKALAKDRDDRHPSAAALQAELSSFLYGQWPGFGRHKVGEFIQSTFDERGFFLELPEELSGDSKASADDESVMRHDEFERAFEHSVIFALDEDIASQDLGHDERAFDASVETTGVVALQNTESSSNKALESWSDEGERTELLDNELFADVPSQSKADASDGSSSNEETLLFSTPLMADPPRLRPKDVKKNTPSNLDAVDTDERKKSAKHKQPSVPVLQRDERTLNESIPAAVFSDQISEQSAVEPISMQNASPSAPSVSSPQVNRPPPHPKPTATLSTANKAQLGKTNFRLKRRLRVTRWLKTPSLYVTLCVLGLLMYASLRIVPGLMTETPDTVTLVVESMPNGARIFINGEDTGRNTKYEFKGLEKGDSQTIKLTLPGHEPMTTNVSLDGPSDGHGVIRVYKTIKLVPEKRSLTIVTKPTGALLTVDGVELGETPQTLNGIENRVGPLKFTLEKSGYKSVNQIRPWPLKPDGELTIVLEPQ